MAASPATDSVQTPTTNEGVGQKVLKIGGAIFGAVIGYLGVTVLGGTLIWPAALIGITWFILTKCKVESVAVPMLAFVVGHTGWMVVGHATLKAIGEEANLISLAVDVVIVIALLIWFLWARSRAAAIGVLVYQILALGVGVLLWGEVLIPGASSQTVMFAQAMHAFLRVTGICLCVYAIAKLRKQTTAKFSEVFE
jgi:hypothetical protein